MYCTDHDHDLYCREKSKRRNSKKKNTYTYQKINKFSYGKENYLQTVTETGK